MGDIFNVNKGQRRKNKFLHNNKLLLCNKSEMPARLLDTDIYRGIWTHRTRRENRVRDTHRVSLILPMQYVLGQLLTLVQFFVTPGTAGRQGPLCMDFSRKEYWNGLPFPTPRDLSDPGIEPTSPRSPPLAGKFFTTVPPGKSMQQERPTRKTRTNL